MEAFGVEDRGLAQLRRLWLAAATRKGVFSIARQGVHAAARDQVPQLREGARTCETYSSQLRAKHEKQRDFQVLGAAARGLLAAATRTRFWPI